MNNELCKIFIIDDDEQVRNGISLLLRSAGYAVESFSGAGEFMTIKEFRSPGCILLDIFLDGASGLELQDEINNRFCCLPIIYITGQGNVPMSVQALKKGAINFLQKPIDDVELLKAVEEAIATSGQQLAERRETEKLNFLIDSLTAREFEIYRLIITGMLNKQIAYELNITEHTVKLHRGKITEKLGLKSVAELVKLAQKLKLV